MTTNIDHNKPGTGLDLEDKIFWPWPRRCAALALASRSGHNMLNFWVWLISKGLSTINTILHTFEGITEMYTSSKNHLWSLTSHVGLYRRTWPWSNMIWPRPRRPLALAMASTMLSSNTTMQHTDSNWTGSYAVKHLHHAYEKIFNYAVKNLGYPFLADCTV